MLGRVQAADLFAVAAITIGVVLRLRWVLQSRVTPVDDTLFYYQHAVDLAHGRGYIDPVTGSITAFIPPGYAFLLGGLFWVTGSDSTRAGALMNVALALAGMVFVYLIARHFFGAWAARAGVLAVALFPSQIMYTPALHADILAQTLVLGVIWAALVAKRPVVAGVLAGCLALTAPRELALVLALVLAWRFAMPWRSALKLGAITSAAAVAVVLPWTIRNAVQLHAFVPIATNGGENLWIGNNPQAYGSWMAWDGGGRTGGWAYPEDEVATDRHYRNEALQYAFQHPIRTVKLWKTKILYSLQMDSGYLGHFAFTGRDHPLSSDDVQELAHRADRYFDAVLLLGLFTSLLILLWRHRARQLVVVFVMLLVPSSVFFGMDRYHITMIPLLSMFAAAGLVWAIEGSREYARRAARQPGQDAA